MREQWHPIGVVGIISAFNFPVAVWSWNTALAWICGDVCVWKASEKAPLCSIACQNIIAGILKEIGVKISSTKGNQTGVENIISSKVEEVSKYYANPTSSAPISSLITNKVGALQNTQNNAIAQTTNSKIDIGGKLEINVNAPAGISTEQLKQSFDTAFNSNSFKDYIVRVASPADSNREPISKTYSA
jgi:delta 1-pyrroline-5-carboxylate dehydrogenase